MDAMPNAPGEDQKWHSLLPAASDLKYINKQ